MTLRVARTNTGWCPTWAHSHMTQASASMLAVPGGVPTVQSQPLLPLQLSVRCAVDHASLCRLQLPLAAHAEQPPGDEEEQQAHRAEQLRATCQGLAGALSKQGVSDCLAWPLPKDGSSGNQPGVVICMHKPVLARAFKAAYVQQAALGLRVTKEIKAHVNLRPLTGGQQLKAIAAGVARTLEDAGWLSLQPGRWLHATPGALLGAAPGKLQTIAHARLAVAVPGTAGAGITIIVMQAGMANYTPFSVSRELGLLPKQDLKSGEGEGQGQVEEEVLKTQVFSSREAVRRSERLLYNTRCVVLPTLMPLFIKGIRMPGQQSGSSSSGTTTAREDQEAEEGARERWRRVAPGLELPQPLPQGGLMLQVSQDPDADCGDCTVSDVPACCCWTHTGLALAKPHTGSAQEQQDAIHQLREALEGSSFRLWGGEPLRVQATAGPSPNPHQPAAPSAQQSAAAALPGSRPAMAAAVAATAAPAAGGRMTGAEIRAARVLLAAAPAGPPAAASAWLTAAQLGPQQDQQQQQVSQPGLQGAGAVAVAAAQAGAAGGAAGGVADAPAALLLPASALWWTGGGGDALMAGLACDLSGLPLDPSLGPHNPHVQGQEDDPRVVAILAARHEARESERRQWDTLNNALSTRSVMYDDMDDGDAATTTTINSAAGTTAAAATRPSHASGASAGAAGGSAQPPAQRRAPQLVGRRAPALAAIKPARAIKPVAAAAATAAGAGLGAATGSSGAGTPAAAPTLKRPAAGSKAAGSKATAGGEAAAGGIGAAKPPAAKKPRTKASTATGAVAGTAAATPATPAVAPKPAAATTTVPQVHDSAVAATADGHMLLSPAPAIGGFNGTQDTIAAASTSQAAGGSSIAVTAPSVPGVARKQGGVGKATPAGAPGAAEASAAGAGAVGAAAGPAAPPRKRTKASDLDLPAVMAKVTAKAAAGQLSSLSIPEMQAWLREHKLPVSGKKADLEARLAAALGTATAGVVVAG